jgi:hypothetical protein
LTKERELKYAPVFFSKEFKMPRKKDLYLDTKKENKLIKTLKLIIKIDWKSLLLILTVLFGAVGTIWNKLEATIDRAINNETQQNVYETLAAQVEELSIRLDRLETISITAKESQVNKAAIVAIKEIEKPLAKILPRFEDIKQNVLDNKLAKTIENKAILAE